MQKVVISIIGFAIAVGLIVGVIVPIASHGKETGRTAKTNCATIDSNISSLSTGIN